MNSCAKLIIFTRYPEPGKTKTRMIPILGREGAANLQGQMSEYTLKTARNLQQNYPVFLEVQFVGGNRQLMENWLGKDLIYQHQIEGDLGQRMQAAFESAFDRGMQQVVIIGTDCPDLTANFLQEALETLHENDLVFGPATDGGYYLIGLSRFIPELFEGIFWGSSMVLAQTQIIAQKLQLKVHYLPILSDVDRPEDLPIWQKYNDIITNI
jgi:uncharacterized protein